MSEVEFLLDKKTTIIEIVGGTTSYILLASVFYTIFYMVNPSFLIKKKYWETAISLYLLFFVYNFIRVYQLRLYDYISPLPVPKYRSFNNSLIDSFSRYFPNLGFFICICLWQNAVKLQDEIIKKEKNLAELNILNIHNKLIFLQTQINPHFLFNTLNLFYVKSLPLDPIVADGILSLSDIMRYALRPALQEQALSQKSLLDEEIKHMQNVIKINRLRFKNKLYLDFDVEGDTTDIYILPLILITLLENLFKHGTVHDPAFPATVKIKLVGGTLEFTSYNKKRGGLKEPSTGIGLDNIRKRLEYSYKDKFRLETEDDGLFYATQLVIDIKL